jgi:tRNA A37 threonylcarbamoyladenosine dehydratase
VRRIYPEWIHSRGGAKGMSALAQKKITLIGCGALGSEVANMLAKAGLQQLVLVDGDLLDWDNIAICSVHVMSAKTKPRLFAIICLDNCRTLKSQRKRARGNNS